MSRRIGDLISVRSRPTVVTLDHLGETASDWITSCFAVTSDVAGHLDALRANLLRDTGCGAFLIGAYGSGKTHLLAYLIRTLESGELLGDRPAPAVVPVSLLNFRGSMPLEEIVADAVGLQLGDGDRRPAWSALMAEHPDGLLLILDELSEFLRSKPDQSSFTEDARFLQYLGEWAQSHRFWVLAAMQEQIEHTGALESSLYRKIKDRYPLRLLLTTTHLRDLLVDGVLERAPGADEAVAEVVTEVRRALPSTPVDEAALAALYPIHPVTLELLEEVRDLFSQARGAVEFVLTELEGDPERGTPRLLDEPWGELLTPDRIFDHFSDLFELQPELLPIAQRLLPHYRRHMDQLFPTGAQRTLAWRLIKLLMLADVSPQREGMSVDEAVAWLLVRASTVTPEANRRAVERVLGQLATDGRYVVRTGARYRLELGDDSAERLERLLAPVVAELGAASPATVWEELAPVLAGDGLSVFNLPLEQWRRHTVRWHFHERRVAFFLGDGEPSPVDEPALVLRVPWGDRRPASELPTLIPAEVGLGEAERALVALRRIRSRPAAAGIRELIDSKIAAATTAVRRAVRDAFAEAKLANAADITDPPVRMTPSTELTRWLDAWGIWLLRRIYPRFETFAPAHGPLTKEVYRSFVRGVLEGDGEDDSEASRLVREGYLVPMGLIRREARSYVVTKDLGRHELVEIVMAMAEYSASPQAVLDRFEDPVYGLVPDQVHLLLIFLVLQGEIDITKGRRSYREVYETMPLPVHYDTVVMGRALSVEQLKALEELCRGLDLRCPRQWTVAAQRQVTARLGQRLEQTRRALEPFLEKVRRVEEGGELGQRIESTLKTCSVVAMASDPIEGVVTLLEAIESPRRFVADLVELERLPTRLERLLRDVRQVRHLLGHPAVRAWDDVQLQTRLEALGEAPAVDDPGAVEAWVAEGRSIYERYALEYRRRHAEWCGEVARHRIWSWQPPSLAHLRHLGLADELEAVEQCRRRAASRRCTGLSDMEYAPRCVCGYDGESAPVAEDLERFDTVAERIERAVEQFFQQGSVRERIAEWHADGIEGSEATAAYLEGEATVPDVRDIRLLDQHLAGLELVHELPVAELMDGLTGRTWTPEALAETVANRLKGLRWTRVRLIAEEGGSLDERAVAWCVRQALRYGEPLPEGIPRSAIEGQMARLSPDAVASRAVGRLQSLRLPEAAEDRIVGWLIEGQVALPEHGEISSPLIAAVRELLRPSSPESPEELGRLAAALYGQHPRLAEVAGEAWLERLEGLARHEAVQSVPELVDVLAGELERVWIVIDCLGLPLLDTVGSALDEALSGWRRAETSCASVAAPTTTDGWLRGLAEAGIQHPLEKVNVIDELLHERAETFANLARLATVELEVAMRSVVRRLDAGSPLLVLSDHGFRLAADGRSWVHGGDSALERLVPVLRFDPR